MYKIVTLKNLIPKSGLVQGRSQENILGWAGSINIDNIREFYLVKKKIRPYTSGIRDIMNLALQNKFYR